MGQAITTPVVLSKRRCKNGVMMASTVNVAPVRVCGRSYSRREIADAVGLHVTTVSKYFSGTRKPSTSAAFRLASFFGISIEELWVRVLPFARVTGPSTSNHPVQPPVAGAA